MALYKLVTERAKDSAQEKAVHDLAETLANSATCESAARSVIKLILQSAGYGEYSSKLKLEDLSDNAAAAIEDFINTVRPLGLDASAPFVSKTSAAVAARRRFRSLFVTLGSHPTAATLLGTATKPSPTTGSQKRKARGAGSVVTNIVWPFLTTIAETRVRVLRAAAVDACSGLCEGLAKRAADVYSASAAKTAGDAAIAIFSRVMPRAFRHKSPAVRLAAVESVIGIVRSQWSGALNDSVLKYLGWMLRDADTEVRAAAVSGWAALAQHVTPSHSGRLRELCQAFCMVVATMALRDKDAAIQTACLEVLTALIRLDVTLLSEEVIEAPLQLLVSSPYVATRRAAAEMFDGFLRTQAGRQYLSTRGCNVVAADALAKGKLKLLLDTVVASAAGLDGDEASRSPKRKGSARKAGGAAASVPPPPLTSTSAFDPFFSSADFAAARHERVSGTARVAVSAAVDADFAGLEQLPSLIESHLAERPRTFDTSLQLQASLTALEVVVRKIEGNTAACVVGAGGESFEGEAPHVVVSGDDPARSEGLRVKVKAASKLGAVPTLIEKLVYPDVLVDAVGKWVDETFGGEAGTAAAAMSLAGALPLTDDDGKSLSSNMRRFRHLVEQMGGAIVRARPVVATAAAEALIGFLNNDDCPESCKTAIIATVADAWATLIDGVGGDGPQVSSVATPRTTQEPRRAAGGSAARRKKSQEASDTSGDDSDRDVTPKKRGRQSHSVGGTDVAGDSEWLPWWRLALLMSVASPPRDALQPLAQQAAAAAGVSWDASVAAEDEEDDSDSDNDATGMRVSASRVRRMLRFASPSAKRGCAALATLAGCLQWAVEHWSSADADADVDRAYSAAQPIANLARDTVARALSSAGIDVQPLSVRMQLCEIFCEVWQLWGVVPPHSNIGDSVQRTYLRCITTAMADASDAISQRTQAAATAAEATIRAVSAQDAARDLTLSLPLTPEIATPVSVRRAYATTLRALCTNVASPTLQGPLIALFGLKWNDRAASDALAFYLKVRRAQLGASSAAAEADGVGYAFESVAFGAESAAQRLLRGLVAGYGVGKVDKVKSEHAAALIMRLVSWVAAGDSGSRAQVAASAVQLASKLDRTTARGEVLVATSKALTAAQSAAKEAAAAGAAEGGSVADTAALASMAVALATLETAVRKAAGAAPSTAAKEVLTSLRSVARRGQTMADDDVSSSGDGSSSSDSDDVPVRAASPRALQGSRTALARSSPRGGGRAAKKSRGGWREGAARGPPLASRGRMAEESVDSESSSEASDVTPPPAKRISQGKSGRASRSAVEVETSSSSESDDAPRRGARSSARSAPSRGRAPRSSVGNLAAELGLDSDSEGGTRASRSAAVSGRSAGSQGRRRAAPASSRSKASPKTAPDDDLFSSSSGSESS